MYLCNMNIKAVIQPLGKSPINLELTSDPNWEKLDITDYGMFEVRDVIPKRGVYPKTYHLMPVPKPRTT